MYATTLAAAPSHRWRASLVLESEAASAAASTMLAAPAAYSSARSVIVGQTSTSVPATADAVIVAIRAPRSARSARRATSNASKTANASSAMPRTIPTVRSDGEGSASSSTPPATNATPCAASGRSASRLSRVTEQVGLGVPQTLHEVRAEDAELVLDPLDVLVAGANRHPDGERDDEDAADPRDPALADRLTRVGHDLEPHEGDVQNRHVAHRGKTVHDLVVVEPVAVETERRPVSDQRHRHDQAKVEPPGQVDDARDQQDHRRRGQRDRGGSPLNRERNRAAEEREPDHVEPIANEPGPVAVDESPAIPPGMRFDVRRHS